jgi:hypothetical protein
MGTLLHYESKKVRTALHTALWLSQTGPVQPGDRCPVPVHIHIQYTVLYVAKHLTLRLHHVNFSADGCQHEEDIASIIGFSVTLRFHSAALLGLPNAYRACSSRNQLTVLFKHLHADHTARVTCTSVAENKCAHTCYSIIAPTLLVHVNKRLRSQGLKNKTWFYLWRLTSKQVSTLLSPHWFLGAYTHVGDWKMNWGSHSSPVGGGNAP